MALNFPQIPSGPGQASILAKVDNLSSSLNRVLKTEQRPLSCLALYGYDRYNSTL